MNTKVEQSHMLLLRLGAGVVTFISALYGPWWLFFISIVICSLCFSWFIEGIVISLFHDTLYGVGLTHFFGIDILMTMVAFFSVACGLFIRKSVRMRKHDRF